MTLSDITVTNLFGSNGELPSTTRLRKIVGRVRTPWFFLTICRCGVSVTPDALLRMASVCRDTAASLVYGDYRTADGADRHTADYHAGCVRNDFDLGPGVLIHTLSAQKTLASRREQYEYAGFYDLRLRLSELQGGIIHLPEVVTALKSAPAADDSGQFGYVDARNSKAQADYERAFTAHLRRINALCTAKPQSVAVNAAEWPVTASVIIPVRNRCNTIADAIESALAQDADFAFNILVVDNHSTDGTSEIIAELSKKHSQVVHIVPRRSDLGIGGCWNEAVGHRLCGAYCVQLDSDDRYASPGTLAAIIGTFRQSDPAMVVGSYTLTDYDGNPIPPGVIDHKEWSQENGRNNLLRVNGIGAPRAFVTAVARDLRFPNVSYGEDYAMALRLSRSFRVERIFTPLYLCRRWDGNSDAQLSPEVAARYDNYKDTLRRFEIEARRRMNLRR